MDTGSANGPPSTSSPSAGKGRAFRSLDKLTLRHGGHGLLYGAALALSAAAIAWAHTTGTTIDDLTAITIR